MKGLLIFIIIVLLSYFAFSAFQKSPTLNTDLSYEKQLQADIYTEYEEDLPVSTQKALVDVNADANNFFDKIQNTIAEWRIKINAYIDARI